MTGQMEEKKEKGTKEKEKNEEEKKEICCGRAETSKASRT